MALLILDKTKDTNGFKIGDLVRSRYGSGVIYKITEIGLEHNRPMLTGLPVITSSSHHSNFRKIKTKRPTPQKFGIDWMVKVDKKWIEDQLEKINGFKETMEWLMGEIDEGPI